MRFVLHEGALDDVDTEGLLQDLAEDVATSAKTIVHKRSERLAESIRVDEVDDFHAVVVADARNPRSSPGKRPYAAHVERGTSDTPALPFLRPALYRHRSP